MFINFIIGLAVFILIEIIMKLEYKRMMVELIYLFVLRKVQEENNEE